jgi:putative spermidine/putrescine transport system ATP-binding protein
MSVTENVEYGLRVRKVGRTERRSRVEEALRLVRLEAHGDRRPAELSGGQRQRVALARALVNEPRVLLLDEPLGALDLKLRQQMQIELKAIQERVGLTFIYVTHDQEEALTMSDRLAVMNDGMIEQVGTPADVYEHPASAFVAGFVGVSNLISGSLARSITGKDGTFTVRPEKIRMADGDERAGDEEFTTTGTVHDVIYLGANTRYVVGLEDGTDLVALRQNLDQSSMEALQVKGTKVRLIWERRNNRPVKGEGQSGEHAPQGR